jgi:hypothetical protein
MLFSMLMITQLAAQRGLADMIDIPRVAAHFRRRNG